MDKVTFFLPTRKGSQRVINKNTRPFAGYEGGLIENKIHQLVQTKKIDEIILSTNDEQCIAIAEKYISDKRLKIISRPGALLKYNQPSGSYLLCSHNHRGRAYPLGTCNYSTLRS